MEYQKCKQTILARIDRGEDIVEKVMEIAVKENINLAHVSAIGAVGDVTIGIFKTQEKKYYTNEFQGDFEITALTGTITTMDDECYCHLHMTIGDEHGRAFGGHLNRAIVSATCEMIITLLEGEVDRKFNSDIGLNLLELHKS